MHSSDAGDAATRGGATRSLGSIITPTHPASSTLASNGALLPFTWSSSGRDAMLIVASPVARTLRSVSFLPTEVNCTIGGRAHATVKNECGARLPTPSSDSVEIHAIGRGTTSELSSG